MSSAFSYHTITGPTSGTLKEKGSRFIAFAYPVACEADIKERLSLLKKEHPSANHHCYAWRLGADKVLYRVNDDGEPSGSAGKPIFSVIQSRDLSNILLVVVRYFGGTLLGVSGLISAYKNAAACVVDLASIIEQFVLAEYEAQFGMKDMNTVMRILKEQDAKIISTAYHDQNILIFRVKKQDAARLESRFHALYTVQLNFLQLQ